VAFSGGEVQRRKARGGGLEGEGATVPSVGEGAVYMGSWRRFSKYPGEMG